MILVDATIRDLVALGQLVRSPITDDQIQPASLDVRLGEDYVNPLTGGRGTFPRWLGGDQFLLGATVEVLHLPPNIAGRLDGKSSLGRQGLLVHSTAGFLDPGFDGQVTLEMSTAGRCSVHLEPGMLIAQVHFMRTDRPADRPYGHPLRRSRYQGQMGPTLAVINGPGLAS